MNDILFHYKNLLFLVSCNTYVLKLDIIPQGSHLHFLQPWASCNNSSYSFSIGDKPLDSNKIRGLVEQTLGAHWAAIALVRKPRTYLAPEKMPYGDEQDAGHLKADVAVHHPVCDRVSEGRLCRVHTHDYQP